MIIIVHTTLPFLFTVITHTFISERINEIRCRKTNHIFPVEGTSDRQTDDNLKIRHYHIPLPCNSLQAFKSTRDKRHPSSDILQLWISHHHAKEERELFDVCFISIVFVCSTEDHLLE